MPMSFSLRKTEILKLVQRLSRADIVFYLMPVLMILLTAGTVAQADMGLYEAHRKFFASFIFFWGPLPLPGGYLVLSILTFHLILKFVFHSTWSWRKSGIILTHLGALVLLIGGLLTAVFAREGYMVLGEGESSPYVYDYHQRELMVFRDDLLYARIPFEALKIGEYQGVLPFTMHIRNLCENCQILKREETEQDFAGDVPFQSMAQFMALEPKEKDKQPEVNLSGLSFTLAGLDGDLGGLYIAFEGMPKPIEFQVGKHAYKMVFGKAQRLLPFSLHLEDFTRENYPGMMKAKAYSSDVVIEDGGGQWQARIEMNAPLRYKGYTFYQSSFDDSTDKEYSVLSVVENKGRIFPYLGTFIIALGLLIHIILIFKERSARA